MSVNLAECGALINGYEFMVTSREPRPYTKKIVITSDANGYPLNTEYYYGNEHVFTVVQTWNAQNQELTWEVLKP